MRNSGAAAVLLSLFASACAGGPETAGLELLAEDPPAELKLHEILSLRPAPKHHFNVDAPQLAGDFPALMKTPRKLRWQLARPGSHRVSAAVCDDALTYCKFAKFEVLVPEPKGRGAAPASDEPVVRQPPKAKHAAVPGFIDNDPAAALARAKKEGKLLFLDFYGIWCPPCNDLEEFVYRRKEFRDASSDLVLAGLDADSDLSWDWKARFKVGGYPTLIVADPELREIGRFVGSAPLPEIVAWISAQKKLRDEPIANALKLPLSDERRKRLGFWRHDRGEFAEAIELLAPLADKESVVRRLNARRRKAAAEGDSADGFAALKELIERYPDDPEFPRRVAAAAEFDKAWALALLAKAFDNNRSWASRPAEAAKSGFDASDFAYDEATLRELAGETAKAKAAYLRVAEHYAERAAASDLELARGANLSRAYYLHKGGDDAGAKRLYEKLAGTYAGEFTFNFEYAEVLLDLKEYRMGREYAEKAVEYSYGDNRLRAVALRARFDLELGRKARARRDIERVLEEAAVPRSAEIRTHAYLARLRALLKKTL